MKRAAVILLLVMIAGCSAPDLIAQESSKQYLEGILTPTYTFNGSTPGPILRATVGEPFSVKVRNTLDEPITVHWHGVRLPNEMDGVPDVTQDPIAPGSTHDYAFTPQDAGVYWYHSHVEAHKQVEMGLQGALIIEDPAIDIHSDTTSVLVVDDVALESDGSYRSFDPNYVHGRFGNIFLVNGEQDPEISLEGGVHRFQIVNTANARTFQLSFGSNPITVYGTDIGYDHPYTTYSLTLHPGERYDVTVQTNTSFSIIDRRREPARLARVTVNASDAHPPNNTFVQENISVPGSVLQAPPEMRLDLQGIRDPDHGLVWQIAGTDSLTNPGLFELDAGYTKVRLRNTQGQPHPMHLHGQQFLVVQRNGVDQERLTWKDNVMVGSRETVDIIVYAQESGDWVFHCHILEHARAGMLTTFRVTS